MNHPKSSLYAALALVLMLAIAIPARSQDNASLPSDQAEPSSAPNATEEIQSEPQSQEPAAAQPQPAKTKQTVHHKPKKKKPVHKAKKKPHHAKKTKKPTKRKKPVHKAKPVKKTDKQVKKEGMEQEPLATEPGETEKEAVDKSETAVPAVTSPAAAVVAAPSPAPAPEPKKSKLAAVKESIKNKAEAAKEKAVAVKNKVASVLSGDNKNAGSKTVTYTFCLGYDNCVPYRYEAMVHGGTVDAKIFKKTPGEGDWNETKIDPVMASDLGAMAKSESGSDVMRPLSLTEKARIADHQGKTHADLVATAESGNKDDLKREMRDVGIKNQNDLETYDPRLAKNATADAAASEIAAGR